MKAIVPTVSSAYLPSGDSLRASSDPSDFLYHLGNQLAVLAETLSYALRIQKIYMKGGKNKLLILFWSLEPGRGRQNALS